GTHTPQEVRAGLRHTSSARMLAAPHRRSVFTSLPLFPLLVALWGAGCDGASGPVLANLTDPETCKTCHPSHYEEWAGSMHAYAAEDPVFRAMNARAQRDNPATGTF